MTIEMKTEHEWEEGLEDKDHEGSGEGTEALYCREKTSVIMA